jgi:hypothetical protein
MQYAAAFVSKQFKNVLLSKLEESSGCFDCFTLYSYPDRLGFFACDGCRIIAEEVRSIGGIDDDLDIVHYYPFTKSQMKKFIKYIKNTDVSDLYKFEFIDNKIKINNEFEIEFK